MNIVQVMFQVRNKDVPVGANCFSRPAVKMLFIPLSNDPAWLSLERKINALFT